MRSFFQNHFSPRSFGGRRQGSGVCVFQISSEFSRQKTKRLCLKMTAKSYSDFLNYITNYFLAICKEPKRVLLSIDWMHRQIISALIVHKLRYRHGIFPLKNEFWAQELRLISTTGRICSKTVVRLRFCNALRQCSWCHRTNKFFGQWSLSLVCMSYSVFIWDSSCMKA